MFRDGPLGAVAAFSAMSNDRTSSLVAAVLFAALSPPSLAGTDGTGLKPGDILGAENCEQATGMLPDEVLSHYCAGEWVNRIVAFDPKIADPGEEWKRSSEANRGKYALDELGTIIDPKTGKQPQFIYAHPFPDIDERDPQVALKLVWDFFYTFYSSGNQFTHGGTLAWLDANSKSPSRSVRADAREQFWDGMEPALRPAENPRNLLSQALAWVWFPADLQGTVTLGYRFRDGDKRDANWAYVPALRRVRAVSPTNRSDGFLGSDLSQDDSFYFDGKPQDFKWRLIGKHKELVRGGLQSFNGSLHWEPGARQGSWRVSRDHLVRAGLNDPSWKGLPWAPIDDVLVERPVWEVEAIPKDRYYLYGRIRLRLDADYFRGTYNSKYSWQGEIMNMYNPTIPFGRSPDGKFWPYLAAVDAMVLAENLKLHRATASVNQTEFWEELELPFDPSFFELDAVVTRGK